MFPKNAHTLIKEQARVIHGEAVDKAKVQAGAKTEAESKNSPESKNHEQNLQTGQGKSRVKIQAKDQQTWGNQTLEKMARELGN